MDKKITEPSIVIPAWGLSLILFSALYLMYSSSFTLDYLMDDELDVIGKSFIRPLNLATAYFVIYGRFLFGLGLSLELHFIHYNPFKIEFVRFINFASIGIMALFLFRFLRFQSQNIYLSFFTVLFLFSQLSFQGLIGYSMLLFFSSQLSMWLSLIAFYLHFYFFQNRQIPKWVAYLVVFAFFMAAMQSTQTYAFFAMVPLSFLLLYEAKGRKQQILIFFALALLSFILSSLIYKATLEYWPGKSYERYQLGESSMGAVVDNPLKVLSTALNPFTYWSAFKAWTYPYPFNAISPLDDLKPIMAMIVMFVWIGLIIAAIRVEFLKQQSAKKELWLKWVLFLGCLAFSALFIIADSPLEAKDHRPHITLTMAGVCIFSGAYALQTLSSTYKVFNIPAVKVIGIAIVLLTCFGAQSGLLGGIVNNRQDQLAFIRTELSNKQPSEYEKILVVLDTSTLCVAEPCDPHFGNLTHVRWHETRDARYKYALATLGIKPDTKKIVFLDNPPDQIASDELIVNWKKYVTANKRYTEYLNWR